MAQAEQRGAAAAGRATGGVLDTVAFFAPVSFWAHPQGFFQKMNLLLSVLSTGPQDAEGGPGVQPSPGGSQSGGGCLRQESPFLCP